MQIVVVIISIILIAFFSFASFMKLTGHAHMKEEFKRFAYPYWLARLSAVLELIGIAGLIAGFYQPLYAALASVWLAGIMVGAAYINFVKRPPAFGIGTLVLMLICLVPALYYYDHLL